MAGLGCWEVDYAHNSVIWSAGAYRLHGVTPLSYRPSIGGYGIFIPAEDRSAFRDLVDRIECGVAKGDAVYRITTPQGEVRWLKVTWTTERQDDGDLRRALGTFQDVTAFKRVEHDLELARSLAQEGSADKVRFLAAASHDLRQPVQSIELLTAVLQRRVSGSELSPVVDMLRKVTADLSGMLTSLLDITRHQAGAVQAVLEPVPLAPLLEGIVASSRPVAETKNLRLRYRAPEMTVLADSGLLQQIVRNLLANAVKYTDRGGILVGARRRGRYAEILVSDTGAGIPADKLDVIFEEFQRLDGPLTDSVPGVGLGLAIVRKAAALMGTRIRVSSRPGRGSTFSLLVEIQPPPASLAAVPGAGGHEFAFPGVEVCVAMADDEARSAVTSSLRSWGARPLEARDIGSLMVTVSTRPAPPQLIVCDRQLALGEDGIEAIRVLRRYHGSVIPAVLMTGQDSVPSPRERPEAVVVLRMPAGPRDLGAAIEQVLAGGPALPGKRGMNKRRRSALAS
ncbi:ATP-binding response regulator [Arenibaculum pallidiluteum]|uniref:ATP-binding response regulator n=1 Tax=Arenibaculum pallidiluteum TaxID=2812559 RepID=UPI001A965665|nr:hybrid sensor histidine kinase/response regulator [Arenibaculum pallidiluteum]